MTGSHSRCSWLRMPLSPLSISKPSSARPPSAAKASETILLQTECVCKTAPAPRARTIATCKCASADGRPFPRTTCVAFVDFEKLRGGERAFVQAGRGDREAHRLRVHHRAEISAGAERPSARVEIPAGLREFRRELAKSRVAPMPTAPRRRFSRESAVPGYSYARIIAPHDGSRKLSKICKRWREDTRACAARGVVTSPSGNHSWEDADGGQDQDSRERADARSRCGAGYAAAVRPRGRFAAARAALRLRARAVRLVLGACSMAPRFVRASRRFPRSRANPSPRSKASPRGTRSSTSFIKRPRSIRCNKP